MASRYGNVVFRVHSPVYETGRSLKETQAGRRSKWPVLSDALLALLIAAAMMLWTPQALAQNNYSAGTGATAPGTSATAVGNNAVASGHYSAAYGVGARAENGSATAIGHDAIASGGAATPILTRRSDGLDNLQGLLPNASTAIGHNSRATGPGSTALGGGAIAALNGGVAVGANARAEAGQSIAIGLASRTTADSAIAMGRTAVATGTYSTALGNVSTARGLSSTAIGHSADAQGPRSIALGSALVEPTTVDPQMQSTTTNTLAAAADAIALGTSARVSSTGTAGIAIGRATSVAGAQAAAIGQGANAGGAGSLAFGVSANSAGAQSLALGQGAIATTQNAMALGTGAQVQAGSTHGIALGNAAIVGPDSLGAMALGRSTQATGASATAMGDQAHATAAGTVAIGSLARAEHANSVALGSQSVTSAPTGLGWRTGTAVPGSTVSVGSATLNRRITNLADGAAESDAVTVRQLQTTTSDLGLALTRGLGGAATYDPATGQFIPPTYEIGGETYRSVYDALEAQEAIVSTLGTTASQSFNSTAGALGGGSTYDPDTGVISTPVYVVDDGTGAATTEVAGVGGAVNNLDTRLTALQTGETGLVQQLAAGGTSGVDPNAPITVGANTGGNIVAFANDAGEARRLTGVANATDATDAVNYSQLQQAIASVEFAEGIYFQVNPGAPTAGAAIAGGVLSTAAGPEVSVSGDYGFGAGYQATVENDAESGIAIGRNARAGSDAATAPGDVGAAVGAVAIGGNAHAGHSASVALGSNAVTIRGAVSDYAAFGLAAPQSSAGEVSIGTAGAERQITNLAAGSAATDAVNVAQLQGASQALGDGMAAALGGGAAYVPATGGFTTPEYLVEGGTVTATGVEGAVTNLDNRLLALQTGTTGLVQQVDGTGAVDPLGTITIGANTFGTVIDITGADGGLRRISGVLNPLEATDAVNMGWVQSQLAAFEVSGLHFFHANPDGVDPDANDSVAAGSHAIAIGPNTVVNADNAVGLGDAVSIATLATDGVGIGRQARLTENAAQSMALGADTLVDHANSIALGTGSATTVGARSDYIAFGLASVPQTSMGELAIGSASAQRQITGVAAGLGDFDAVNVQQLRGTSQALGESIAQAFGGTASYDAATGTVSLPTYQIEGEPAVGVDGAIQNLFGRTEINENQIAALAAPETGRVSIAENNIQGLLEGQLGLVRQSNISAIEPITVGGHTGGNVVDFTNANDFARTLRGVAAGELSASSNEAVAGSQLFATNQQVATNANEIAAARNNLLAALGGGASYVDGAYIAPQYVFAADGTYLSQSTYQNVGDALSDLDARVRGTMAALGGGASYDAALNEVTAPNYIIGQVADAPHTNVGSALTALDNIAIVQGQTTAAALGGGSAYTPATGEVTAPVYTINGAPVTGVEAALTNIDNRTVANETSIAGLQDAISDGTVGLVQQDAATRTITVAAGTDGDTVSFANVDGETRTLTGISEGAVTGDSTDAVTGSQLFATNTRVGGLENNALLWNETLGAFDATRVTPGGTAPGRITNVAQGAVTATSSDAIVGSQLFLTRQAIAAGLGGGAQVDPATGELTGPIYQLNSGDYTDVGAALLAQDGVLASQGSTIAAALGGGSTYNPVTGALSTPTYTVGDGAGGTTLVTGLNELVTNVDNRTVANETSIANLQDAISDGTVGLVQQDAATRTITVAAGTDGDTVSFANNAGTARQLTGVAAGDAATDGVNVGQLNQQMTNVYEQLREDIQQAGVLNLAYYQAHAGPADAPYVGALAQGDRSIAMGQEATTQNAAARSVAVGADSTAAHADSVALGANSVTIRGAQGGYSAFGLSAPQSSVGEIAFGTAAGARQVTGVAAGSADTDAVNVAQLRGMSNRLGSGMADALGGGAAYDPLTGEFAGPSYTVGGQTVTNIGDAISNVDSRTAANETQLAGLQDAISDGTVGLVQQDAATRTITVAAGTDGDTVSFANVDGETRTLTGISEGAVTGDSTDAVTGSQLFATNTRVGGLENNALLWNETLGAFDATRVTPGGTAPGRITNVAQGAVTATSSDAIVGSQLFLTRQAIAAGLGGGAQVDPATGELTGPIYQLNSGDYTDVGSALLAQDGVLASQGNTIAAALGGGSTYNPVTGALSTPTYTVGDGAGGTTLVTGLNELVTNIDNRTGANETSIANLQNAISDGTVGLVQQDAATRTITVAAGTDGDMVSFANNVGTARQLTGVAAGSADTDAVNVAQLRGMSDRLGSGMADALGGGAAYDPLTGEFAGPSYTVGGQTVTNIGDAISNVDSRTAANETQLADHANTLANHDSRIDANTTNITNLRQDLASGNVGLVQQDAATRTVTVAAGTNGNVVSFANVDGETRTLTGVAPGEVAANSTDAINGSQLHGVSQSIASALGGDSVVNEDGRVTAPNWAIRGQTYQDIGSAFGAIDGLIAHLEQNGVGGGPVPHVGANTTLAPAAATGQESAAFGGGSAASGDHSSALGSGALAAGSGSTAVGSHSVANGANSSAFGRDAVASAANSTALGAGANAGHANSTAIGAGATTTRENQVALGTASSTYSMPGIVTQASRAAQGTPVGIVTSDAQGNLATMDLGDFFTPLNNANRAIERAHEGVAMAIAMGGVFLPADKDFAVSVNYGNFDGKSALGFGAIGSVSDNVYLNGGFGIGGSSGTVAGRVGATLAW